MSVPTASNSDFRRWLFAADRAPGVRLYCHFIEGFELLLRESFLRWVTRVFALWRAY